MNNLESDINDYLELVNLQKFNYKISNEFKRIQVKKIFLKIHIILVIIKIIKKEISKFSII